MERQNQIEDFEKRNRLQIWQYFSVGLYKLKILNIITQVAETVEISLLGTAVNSVNS